MEEVDVESQREAGRPVPHLVLVNFATINSARHDRVDEIRVKHGRPIVCLLPHPKPEECGQVVGLGADAVVFKPLRLEELASRIRLLMWQSRPESSYPIFDRRRRSRRSTDRELTHAQTSAPASFLQIKEREKLVIFGRRRVHLTPKEFGLLSLLASDPGRVFSKKEIIARLWQGCGRPATGDVQQYICLLRKKLEEDPANPTLIKTVPSFGYKLECPEPCY